VLLPSWIFMTKESENRTWRGVLQVPPLPEAQQRQ
jgi:hypothetical protein